jgi:hypothetical protein
VIGPIEPWMPRVTAQALPVDQRRSVYRCALFRSVILGFGIAFATPAIAEPEIGSRIDRAPGSVGAVESEDQATARRVMRRFSGCVARARRRWAETAVQLPIHGAEQNSYIARHLSGEDDCMGYSGAELRFQPALVVGGMAEELIETHYRSADLGPVAQLSDAELEARGLMPRNGNEDFAICVVRRDPVLVRELLRTTPATPREMDSARRLTPHLGHCLYQGQTMNFHPSALRTLLAPSLYRILASLVSAQGTSRR